MLNQRRELMLSRRLLWLARRYSTLLNPSNQVQLLCIRKTCEKYLIQFPNWGTEMHWKQSQQNARSPVPWLHGPGSKWQGKQFWGYCFCWLGICRFISLYDCRVQIWKKTFCRNSDKFGYGLIKNDIMFMYILCIYFKPVENWHIKTRYILTILHAL